ncbi:mercuric resistance operon regulatory protein merP related protein [mine drainage metagenome]|uniref:Mercuric resistance operon regulatory protein merP related protein n=1 Tax=mine drainage metagenome TaxID=410659 RepID=T0ZD74_9ZZZZ
MATKKLTMKVYGMTCDDCVRHVTKDLMEGGADKVYVSLKDGMASAVIDDSKVLPEELVKLPVFGKDSQYKAQLRRIE